VAEEGNGKKKLRKYFYLAPLIDLFGDLGRVKD
jgi:hypothetical protein